MKRFLSLVVVLFVTVIAANPSAAQDRQGSENSLLPEIDPQDIEIRSQFKARFPGLRRQPILGFDPTPRVYQIDPNREPFMETQEQIVANLPVSELSRPAPPPYTPLDYSSSINAFGRAGMGSYLSPEVNFWGVSRINTKSYIGGDLDYSSSDGHLDTQESSFRFLNAHGEYASKLSEKTRIGLYGGFESSFNNLFDVGGSGISDDARKEYDGFHIGTEFQQFQNTITGWKVAANIRYFNARLKEGGVFSGKGEERVYGGSVAKSWTGSHLNETFTIKGGVKGGNYDNLSPEAEEWLTAHGGIVYERLFNYKTKIFVDAGVYYGMDKFDNRILLGPKVKIEHPILDILTLTVKGGAEPYVKTLEQLHNENRFLNVETELRHSYRINGSAEAGLKYANQASLNLGIQYENISDYPIFTRNSVLSGDLAFYRATPEDIYRAKAYVSVNHQIISDRFWINGKFYLQSPEVKGGGRIPYEEKIGANSAVIVRPFDQLTFEAWADYVGSRRTSETSEKLDGFILLGGQVDIQITERLGVYAKLVNILNQDYQIWQGYTERPFQAYGGVTVKL